MDRALKTVERSSKRCRNRNYQAWQRFSPDGKTCRFCPHDHTTHLCSSGQPHFYRNATEGEERNPSVRLYRRTLPQGGSISIRRMVVAKSPELITAFCTACAEEMRTDQVLCYLRTLAVGEMVGAETERPPAVRPVLDAG